MEEVLAFDTDKMTELDTFALEKTCKLLDIDFQFTVFSNDTMGIENVSSPDEWALKITQKKNANTYINPPGGKSFFNKDKYEKAGINLKFLTTNLSEYKSMGVNYIPGLSIIDVMMFNSPEEINSMLDNYELD